MNLPRTEPLATAATAVKRLAISTLSAGYGQRPILEEVTLSLPRAELVAIIGPNGAGKSTLLKAVMGLASVTAGSIYVDGVDIEPWEPHERARNGIAYVMQGGAIFPGLTIAKNLEAATADLAPEDRSEGIDQALALFDDFEMNLDRRAGLLSGGERQMLALAMIFARRPRVLLLDEPSAGLAPRLVESMLAKTVTICREWGTSVLLVEQNVRAALGVADRALLLDHGRVVGETSEPLEWVTSGYLERMLWGHSSAEG